MPCEADGFPIPEVMWYRGGSLIESSASSARRKKLPNNNSLFIGNLNLDDEGLYTCSVSNMFGTVRATAQLTVTGTGKPKYV